jgi:hypothetical protein
MWTGVIVEESLEDKAVLKKVKIVKTKESFDDVTQSDWRIHTVEVDDKSIEVVVKLGSKCIKEGWWMDFRRDNEAFIILKNKIFKITQDDLTNQKKAREYAISHGVDPRQAEFTKYFSGEL